MSLLTDDQCRVCFHVHPNEHPCTQIAHDPGPDDTDIASVCGCPVYVDLEAESHIMVRPVSARGFRIFHRQVGLLVNESSLAGEGPHVRIYGGHNGDDRVHLSLQDAKAVRDALTAFITEAEADMLTERAR